MEWVWLFAIRSFLILSPALVLKFHRRRKSGSHRLPPGPPGLPVLGHILSLGTTPHKTMMDLKQQYGPVIWLRLGSLDTMVIQSAEAATEFFKNHDLMFTDRMHTQALMSHDWHKSSVAIVLYGPFWRALRRLCTIELFTKKRIVEMASSRRKCVDELLLWIDREANDGGDLEGGPRGVHVGRLVFLALFNMIGNMVLSRDLVDPKSKVGSEFFVALTGMAEWLGRPNVSDFFPWLKALDLQGIKRKMDRDLGKTLEIASGLVKQRVKERETQEEGRERRKDFLEVLLDFEGTGKDEPAKLSEKDITVFISDMFVAGVETTTSTTEWALTELLCNPEAMDKVKAELTKIVGPNKKLEDNDIDNLHYLQAVIKETLRLHPPIPMLVPRHSTQDASFMGYHVPKHTQVIVNVWAIARDPKNWEDPLSFKPERFLGSKIDFKGQHFDLLPFGAGRRVCPAAQLVGHYTLPFILGSLLHEFDWEIDGHVSREKMDMKEKMGMAMRKLEPLKVIPKKRQG